MRLRTSVAQAQSNILLFSVSIPVCFCFRVRPSHEYMQSKAYGNVCVALGLVCLWCVTCNSAANTQDILPNSCRDAERLQGPNPSSRPWSHSKTPAPISANDKTCPLIHLRMLRGQIFCAPMYYLRPFRHLPVCALLQRLVIARAEQVPSRSGLFLACSALSIQRLSVTPFIPLCGGEELNTLIVGQGRQQPEVKESSGFAE